MDGWIKGQTTELMKGQTNLEDRKGPEVELFSVLCSSPPCFSLKSSTEPHIFPDCRNSGLQTCTLPGDELFQRLSD